MAVSPAFAGDTAVDTKAITASLSSAPALELAPTAAKLVNDASAKDLETTVREVVRASVKLNSSATVPVVGSISAQKPAMAPTAAGTAAILAPKQAVAIAKAAAVSAPSQAGKIVQAVCEAAPKQYKEIAMAVSKVAPDAGKDILDGLAMALPDLKDKLTQSSTTYNGAISTASLGTILQQLEKPTVVASTPSEPGRLDITPDPGPPFVPPLTSPNEIHPGDNNPEGPGGRNYSPP